MNFLGRGRHMFVWLCLFGSVYHLVQFRFLALDTSRRASCTKIHRSEQGNCGLWRETSQVEPVKSDELPCCSRLQMIIAKVLFQYINDHINDNFLLNYWKFHTLCLAQCRLICMQHNKDPSFQLYYLWVGPKRTCCADLEPPVSRSTTQWPIFGYKISTLVSLEHIIIYCKHISWDIYIYIW